MRPRARTLFLTAVLACSGTDDGAITPPPSPSANACAVRQAGAVGPITDPNGPYYHQMAIAQTTDGLALTGAHIVLDHASVPDGVRRADGTVLAYYVNGAEGPVWVARIEGDSAVPLGRLTVNGVSPVAGVVDPDAWLMPEGKIRLAYLSGFGPPSSRQVTGLCIAESTDGLSFTVLGTAFPFAAGEFFTDPSLVAGANLFIFKTAD